MINVKPRWFCLSSVYRKAGLLVKTVHCCSLPLWFLDIVYYHWECCEQSWGEKQLRKDNYCGEFLNLNLSKSSWKETGTLTWIGHWTSRACRAGSNEVLCSSICPLHIIGSQLINHWWFPDGLPDQPKAVQPSARKHDRALLSKFLVKETQSSVFYCT